MCASRQPPVFPVSVFSSVFIRAASGAESLLFSSWRLGVLAFISCFDRSTTRPFGDADAAAADEACVIRAEDAERLRSFGRGGACESRGRGAEQRRQAAGEQHRGGGGERAHAERLGNMSVNG